MSKKTTPTPSPQRLWCPISQWLHSWRRRKARGNEGPGRNWVEGKARQETKARWDFLRSWRSFGPGPFSLRSTLRHRNCLARMQVCLLGKWPGREDVWGASAPPRTLLSPSSSRVSLSLLGCVVLLLLVPFFSCIQPLYCLHPVVSVLRRADFGGAWWVRDISW